MATSKVKLSRWFLAVVAVVLSQVFTVTCLSEAELLIQFKGTLENNGGLSNWDTKTPPCNGDKENWVGVLCDKGNVWGLKLENMGLKGSINVAALSQLQDLRTISLMNNDFTGSLPQVNKLGALKSLYLSHNKFSGEIPSSTFEGMLSIKKIHLADNQFSGSIPASLAGLPKLMELMLDKNQFSGQIPDFKQDRLNSINLSNNHLEGPIPASLSKVNKNSFAGNEGLCGGPLEKCPEPEKSEPKLSVGTIVIVVIAVVIAVGAIIAVVVILRRRKTAPQQEAMLGGSAVIQHGHNGAPAGDLDKLERGMSPDRGSEGKKGDQNIKLSFLRDDVGKFDMTDLLKASAEVLGSGTFGSTYKAALSTGPVTVVKRYRHMNNVNKEEFHEHMRRLGRLNHPNVLPIVAFYYRKEEKLIVSSYVHNVSLAVHLHGNKSRGQPSPDWPTRLKIIKGVSRGLLYLYNSLPSLVAPHGHLKSSNVILNESNEPMLTDYGLLPVVNLEQAQEQMIAYKSPEFKQHGRITKKTDVWSLGVLILEILTGKFPSNFLQQGKGSDGDLATWVQSIVKDEWTADVFDRDMTGTNHCEGEIMKLLKIALDLCEPEIDKRWDIKEAVDRIEEIKERDDGGGDDYFSSYTSETDMRSSRGLSEDFINVPMNG
ncbi:OLC1v1035792C1 [Oldenlandia corymbosa var. corymbosa]|uniref:non-specific serine/threonine protein kinase n=1 Tax=Oldenlandia corymbosa var. corymbosa TaxID=529605 RepID=A0AAV1CTU0_OLDCO|nr:OLC1v1035792C1 [Oldenlandia corymbosa var. corymbosa]